MKHTITYFAAAALLLGLYGCGAPSESQPSTESPLAETTNIHGGQAESMTGDHAQQGKKGPTDMEKMKAELAKLSKEDAASALAQHVCPVSGGMLGIMGAPIKVDVGEKQVWICCEGCRSKLLKKPDEYLAKLQN